MELTPQNLQFLFQGFNQKFQQGYQRRKVYHEAWAEDMPSSTEIEVYGWLAEIPGLRKWVGPRLIRNISGRSYQLINDDYEDTIGVNVNKIKDDTYGFYDRRFELLGDAASRWGDDIVTDVMINGITNLCYDGQAFFSSAHPVDLDDATQGTYSNRLDSTTSGALPLNNASTYLDNFATAYATMLGFKGESGKALEVTPTLLVVPPQLQKYAKLIESGEYVAQAIQQAGANVAAAAQPNPYKDLIKAIVVPRLVGDPNTWYLLSTDRIKPFIFQQRQAPEMTQIVDPQSLPVFMQKQFLYGLWARGAAGYTLPFTAIRCST